MKAPELARIARLVALMERRRDEIAAALRQACASVAAAATTQARAEEAHEAAARAPLPVVVTAHDLAAERGYVRELGRAVRRADDHLLRCRAAQEKERERVAAAERDVRKLERWAERVEEAQSAETERREVRLGDEHVARAARRSAS